MTNKTCLLSLLLACLVLGLAPTASRAQTPCHPSDYCPTAGQVGSCPPTVTAPTSLLVEIGYPSINNQTWCSDCDCDYHKHLVLQTTEYEYWTTQTLVQDSEQPSYHTTYGGTSCYMSITSVGASCT